MPDDHDHLRAGGSWAVGLVADRFADRPIAHFDAIRAAVLEARWPEAALLVAAVGVLADRGQDTLALDQRLKERLGFDWEVFQGKSESAGERESESRQETQSAPEPEAERDEGRNHDADVGRDAAPGGEGWD